MKRPAPCFSKILGVVQGATAATGIPGRGDRGTLLQCGHRPFEDGVLARPRRPPQERREATEIGLVDAAVAVEVEVASPQGGLAARDGVTLHEGDDPLHELDVAPIDDAMVAGFYNYGAGIGQLDGRVEGSTAHFEWRSGGEMGRATLTARDGELAGSWGYGASDSDGGEWRAAPAQ